MVARKAKGYNFKDIVIGFLLLVVVVQTYYLYQSHEPFREFISRSSSSQSETTEPVKKRVKKAALVDLETSSKAEKKSEGISVPPVVKSKKTTAVVAIVIDDWGYSTKNCGYLKSIDSSITVAVLPDLAHSSEVMQCAHEAGKEIMLHLPMEPHNNQDHYPDDYLLKTSMSPIKIDNLLTKILDKMPLVAGVNNHMGSRATEDRKLISTVFKQLKHRGLFYVDSKVTGKSVCAVMAKQQNVPFASRDVFLDNVNDRAAIEAQLVNLVRIAQKRGKALAIGHDRSLTLQVIQDRIPWFREQGVKLVSVKEYINTP